MKSAILCWILTCFIGEAFAQASKAPLKKYMSDETKTQLANENMTPVQRDSMSAMKYSAVKYPCNYMTEKEKEVIHYLNLARMYPKWFVYFFLKHPTTENEKSLYKTMMEMKTIPEPLKPSKDLFESAKCHAISSGKVGYVGHDRIAGCKSNFRGECCDYGVYAPAQIVLSLLVDEGVPSLGHRFICLSDGFQSVGISIQPHKNYGTNCVLDFGY